jgi:hypothetical protein
MISCGSGSDFVKFGSGSESRQCLAPSFKKKNCTTLAFLMLEATMFPGKMALILKF